MKFTSIILALLLAPSKADLPANSGSGSDAAAGRLGGKSARMLEEEAEADESAMAMGGGKNKKGCAASRPAVAVEQVFIAFLLTDMLFDGGPFDSGFAPFPSLVSFFNSNYDESIDDISDDIYIVVAFLINRVLSEMSCEEYIEGQKASVLFKLSTSGDPFGPWGGLKETFASADFDAIKANLGNYVDMEKAAAYAFLNSTSDESV